jgi:hypothetical protein
MKANIRLKAAAAACALAFAGTAAQAAPFDAPQITVFLSGASAPQNFLGAMATQLFQGTQNTDWWAFYSNDGTVGANYRAYYGTLKTTVQDPNMPASIAGKTALVINRAKGGSVWGVNPVARTQQIQWMERSNTNCATNTSTAFNFTCAPTGDDTGSNGVIPDFGVSDVEPAMFKFGRNTEFDISLNAPSPELTPGELASLTVKGVSALMFGQAATTSVTSVISDMPRDMFGALLNGTITSWAKVSPAFAAPLNVAVCRRVPGSGTQTSYNQFYHNWPCSVNNITQDGTLVEKRMYDSAGYGVGGLGTADGSSAANAIGIDMTAGFTVIENSTSGNVRTCLQRVQTGTDFTFQDEAGVWHVAQFGGAGGRKAVGVLSLDSKGSTGYGVEWNFLNVNGVAPDQANLISLQYPFHYELSMQYNTARYGTLTGDQQTLITEFIKRSGDPVILAAISNVNVRDAVAAVPINFAVGSHAKVMKGTRFANSCRPVQPQ